MTLGLSALQITLEGVAATMPFAFGPDSVGPVASGAGIAVPRGAAVALDAVVLRGGGELSGSDGAYAGGVTLTLPPMSVAAFGSFDLPGPGRPDVSLLIILGVRFPLPGIEIGFGFAVSAVGGIVGLNRRVDRDALTAAVLDGRAAQLLLPTDPAAALPMIATMLPALFPPAPGRFVIGPIVEASWGGRLVRLVVAVVVELPDPVRFTVLGKITVTVPDEVAPLILIQATVLADVDTAAPGVTIVASLAGSNLVGMPLSGDLFLLTRGGSDPEFVVSAGGFHPAFHAPAGVPALRRLSIRMRTAIVELRCDAYLALTSGSVQFGARVQISAKLADCGVTGFFGFDALFVWNPVFHFSIGLAAGLAVEVFGATLLGISIQLTIEGPSPWHFVGTGHIETFLFDIPISIDETWGGDPPKIAPGDAATPLLAALAAREAWRTSADPSALAGVVLTDDGTQQLASGAALHPLGNLQARQSVVPLAIQIDRFAGGALPPQTWTIVAARLRAGENTVATTSLQDWFALGQFVDLAPDAQLGGSGYHQLQSGVTLIGDGIDVAEARAAEIDWETTLIGDGVATLDRQPAPWSGQDDTQSLPLHLPFAVADWVSPPAALIEVVPEQPATVALTSPMAASALGQLAAPDAPVANAAIARDWAERSAPAGLTASVVETWELAG